MLWRASVALAACAGSLVGFVLAFALRTDLDPPAVIRGSGATIGSVVLEGFRDGALRGEARGPVRLYAVDDPVAIDASGAFAIEHPSLRIEEVSVRVPSGMSFVASRKGKKYYAVDSAAGERIAPQNRVYFPDASSAERAGFRP